MLCKKRKGFVSLLTLLVIGFITTTLLVSGVAGIVYGIIISPKYCNDEPFAENCFCDTEVENKIRIWGFSSIYIPKYICESKNLMFDPDSPTFRDDALAYSKQMLLDIYPSCDSTECPSPASLYSDAEVVYLSDARAVKFECRSEYGVEYWSTLVGLETGSLYEHQCRDIQAPLPPQTEPMKLTILSQYHSTKYNLHYTALSMTNDCMKQNGKAEITVTIPSHLNANSWALTPPPYGFCQTDRWYACKYYEPITTTTTSLCSITSHTDTSATISCDAGCPTIGFTDSRNYLFAYLA